MGSDLRLNVLKMHHICHSWTEIHTCYIYRLLNTVLSTQQVCSTIIIVVVLTLHIVYV